MHAYERAGIESRRMATVSVCDGASNQGGPARPSTALPRRYHIDLAAAALRYRRRHPPIRRASRRDEAIFKNLGWLGHALSLPVQPHRCLAFARGGSYRFSGGNGSRTGSGRIFARIAFSISIRGDSG
jgi:hypothetical protein